jgi:hypothetical protein
MSTRWSLLRAPSLAGLTGWILFAGLAWAQGPAQGPPPPATPPAGPVYRVPPAAPKPSAWFPRLDGQLLRNADGAAVGQVTLAANNQLVIVSPGNAPLRLRMDANLPVFEGENALSRGPGKLRPGTDVKVYYRRDAGQADPRTVAVVVLDPQTAQALLPRQAPDSMTAVSRQPGRVVSVSNGILELDPYEEAAGHARVTLGPGAVVARGAQVADTSALRPGTEVMVTYRSAPDGHAVALRVDILSPDEAAKLRRDYARVPAQRRPPL